MKLKKYFGLYRHYLPWFDDSKSIFIHIPKAAGMSVVDGIYNKNVSHHSTWLELYNQDSQKFDTYFKFSFSREPVSRCYSAYSYLRKGGKGPMDKYWFEKHIKPYSSFEDFVLFGLNSAVQAKAEHFIPQNEFIFSDDNILKVDFLGRYESLDRDFELVKKQLGISAHLSNRNQTINKSDVNFKKEIIDKIQKVYKRDYDLLNY